MAHSCFTKDSAQGFLLITDLHSPAQLVLSGLLSFSKQFNQAIGPRVPTVLSREWYQCH